ncbi:MAG: hypothetical protein P1Q69_20560, partial [Candidatus Thorarchaeota archaeon]|nr:hypothetical protein [Candidatus Thorarchaeota archaeon]
MTERRNLKIFHNENLITTLQCSSGQEEALARGYLICSQYVANINQIQGSEFDGNSIQVDLGHPHQFQDYYVRKVIHGIDEYGEEWT